MNSTLLALDEFFGAPEITGQISGALDQIAAQFEWVEDEAQELVPAPTDSAQGASNYALFQDYSKCIDVLLEHFAAAYAKDLEGEGKSNERSGEQEEEQTAEGDNEGEEADAATKAKVAKLVLDACREEWKKAGGNASVYTCLEFINAAIEFDVFAQLVAETQELNEYQVE